MAEAVTKKVNREDRRDQVMALALAGGTVRSIAKVLGWSRGTVQRDIESRIKETAEQCPDTNQYREIHRQRISRLIAHWWKRAESSPSAVDRVLQLMRREAQLLGLDAPQKIDHRGNVRVDTKPDMSALTDEDIADIRAKFAAKDADAD